MSDEQSIRGEPSLNEIRADFITLHTRNFDAYMVGRSLTSEQEFYGAQFDSVIRRIQAEAIRTWADFQDAAIRNIAFAADDEDRAEVNRWTVSARVYADRIERGETA